MTTKAVAQCVKWFAAVTPHKITQDQCARLAVGMAGIGLSGAAGSNAVQDVQLSFLLKRLGLETLTNAELALFRTLFVYAAETVQ